MKTILVDAVDTFVIEGEGVNQEMHELLEAYPNRKIVVTNANDEQMIKFGLTDLPYELFTLKQNPQKTDPSYFKQLLQHYSLSAADVIYFEHNPEAVKSAESVGITSYFYDPETRDLLALKAFLDASM